MEIIDGENSHWQRLNQRNRMRLMMVDPFTLHVYWEVSPLRKRLAEEHFQCNWYDLPLYLHLYDATGVNDEHANISPMRSDRVHAESDHWYFRHLAPQRRYYAQLTTTTWLGSDFALLQSNLVATPPLQNSAPHDDVFFRSEFDGYSFSEGRESV